MHDLKACREEINICMCSTATYLSKKKEEEEEEEEGNPTTNARNFQFLVCLNDSFSRHFVSQEEHKKWNGNLRLFSQWKVQQWKLPISRKCNRAVGARNARRGLGHVWYMGLTVL